MALQQKSYVLIPRKRKFFEFLGQRGASFAAILFFFECSSGLKGVCSTHTIGAIGYIKASMDLSWKLGVNGWHIQREQQRGLHECYWEFGEVLTPTEVLRVGRICYNRSEGELGRVDATSVNPWWSCMLGIEECRGHLEEPLSLVFFF